METSKFTTKEQLEEQYDQYWILHEYQTIIESFRKVCSTLRNNSDLEVFSDFIEKTENLWGEFFMRLSTEKPELSRIMYPHCWEILPDGTWEFNRTPKNEK